MKIRDVVVALPAGKTRNIDDVLRSRLGSRSLARARRRADILLERMTLNELRKDRKRTQGEVASTMQVLQSEISRMERRSEVKLGTLREYVSALGGHVEVRAVFPDKSVELALAGD